MFVRRGSPEGAREYGAAIRNSKAKSPNMTIEFSRWPDYYGKSFQVTKTLGLASIGFADVTEIFEACKGIDPKRDETWIKEWLATAAAVERHAKASEAVGNWHSARDAYCRACNYTRTAEFMVMEDEAEKVRLIRKSKELFEAAGKYFEVPPEKVYVDYEGEKLEG